MTTMPAKRRHNRYIEDNHDLIKRHAYTRSTNFPTWVTQVHPGTHDAADVSKIPSSYLRDLYPAIWRWGPRGETYLTQLTRIEDLLDHTHDPGDVTFLEAISQHLRNLATTLHTAAIVESLTNYAGGSGLPLPGDDILYGINANPDPSSSAEPINRLLRHPIVNNYLDDGEVFADFIYQFALASIHQAFFKQLATRDPTIQGVLDNHADFCARWDIPTGS